MKKTFLMAVTAMTVMFTACTKAEEEKQPEIEKTEFVGTLVVKSSAGDVTNDSTKVIIEPDEKGAAIDILLYGVKFSPRMPMTIDVTIPSVPARIDSEGRTTFSGTDIVPTAMGGPYAQYTVTELEGSIADGKCSFNLKFGDIPASFSGSK